MHMCRGPRRNHVCRFVLRSVTGFGRGGGSNFGFLHWLASSPLQHSRTTVRVSDLQVDGMFRTAVMFNVFIAWTAWSSCIINYDFKNWRYIACKLSGNALLYCDLLGVVAMATGWVPNKFNYYALSCTSAHWRAILTRNSVCLSVCPSRSGIYGNCLTCPSS